MAVEGVGLALGGAAAAGTVDVDEVGALGERVAFAGRGDVARQHHRQVPLGHRHRPTAVAEDDRDRRTPGTLARDREVVVAVAFRLLAPAGGAAPASSSSRPSSDTRPSCGRSPRRPRPRPGCRTPRSDRSGRRRSVRRVPAAAPGGSGDRCPGVDDGTAGVAGGASQPPERICSSASRAAAPVAQASTSGGAARAGPSGPGRGRRGAGEDAQRGVAGTAQIHLDAVAAAEDVALVFSARSSQPRACRGCGRSPPDRESCGGTRSAGGSGAPGCGSASSDRPPPGAGERRLAGVAPVDGGVVAVNQIGLEQLRKSHCDQRYCPSSEL